MKTLVKGTIQVEFYIEIDAEDISVDGMNIKESDELILDEINGLLPSRFYTEGNPFVKTFGKVEEFAVRPKGGLMENGES